MTIPVLKRCFTPADNLVDKFCSGQINEAQFAERAASIGIPIEEVHGLIFLVREEDAKIG